MAKEPIIILSALTTFSSIKSKTVCDCTCWFRYKPKPLGVSVIFIPQSQFFKFLPGFFLHFGFVLLQGLHPFSQFCHQFLTLFALEASHFFHVPGDVASAGIQLFTYSHRVGFLLLFLTSV